MKAVDSNVLKFIGGLDKVFAIPPFQRNYEWSIEQCDELFYDIIKSYKTGKNHYIGNIVYYIGENSGASFSEYILIDGQQRITTILLLLCAIRDYVKNDDELRINSRYLKNDTKDERYRIKLKQTTFDAKIFAKIIDGKINEINENEKNNHVFKNYNRFIELLEKCIKEDETLKPDNIYGAIQKLDVVDVNLDIKDDLESVQTVFEKINSTGKKLEPSDLIRNFLLLSNNMEEQQELYDNYWVKLEETLGSNNVTRFSRDYLITKIFDDVQSDKVYLIFKNHFINSGIKHIEILKDMQRYAEYYSWMLNATCSDNDNKDEINGYIKFFNLLKTDDLYPLYMILFERLYNNDRKELKKILNLLCDFMLRYRIVSPSGGGGALRTAIHTLLDKISNNNINITYDDILFELSNSSTPANRFPDDDDFKQTLKNAVNITYARALLYKMEQVETKNIPVPIDKVTIEHLMPQTLSNWWKDYLVGKDDNGKIDEEKVNQIYNKYINCIGNLAPISGPYNSQNSNNQWKSKLNLLKEIQFSITSEISNNINYQEWKQENIEIRNEDISERACKDITGPLPRTREYESRVATTDFEPGLYDLGDLTTPMSGQTPTTIIYKDNNYEISGWFELVAKVCEILYSIDSDKLKEIVVQNKIHKSTSKHNIGIKDPILSYKKEFLISSLQIKDTGIYVETSLSSNRARYYTKQILDLFELTDEFQLYVY